MENDIEETDFSTDNSAVSEGDPSDEVLDHSAEIGGFSRASREEYKVFKSINRDEEDRLVVAFGKSNDPLILVKLLEMREQTIRHMAKKYAYLENEEDMYSEFKRVWLKCIKRYDAGPALRQARDKKGVRLFDSKGNPKIISKKTAFNTYLFTSMQHRVWNLLKRRFSKRLLDANGRPAVETMRSLDYRYGEDSDMTLKDKLPDLNARKSSSQAEMSDLMHHLGGDSDPDIKRAVETFLSNPRFGSIEAACNFRVGTLRTTKWDNEVLSMGEEKNGRTASVEGFTQAMTYLKKMVDSTGTYAGKYDLVSFVLHPNRVDFVAKVADSKTFRKVKEAVRRCRAAMGVDEKTVEVQTEEDDSDLEVDEAV